MRKEVVIIGGGVGGLCAAIECCRLGLYPLVIEGGKYPSHKVCGEFLSPESLPFLQSLDILPPPIVKSHFQIGSKELLFPFLSPAGSLSHWTLDPALAAHARFSGAEIQTEVKVVSFVPKQYADADHVLGLSTGQTVRASSVIIATGRLPSLSPPATSFKYMGIKAHFEGILLDNTLEMFGFDGAYLGLSPIEEGKANLACLALTSKVAKAGSIQNLMESLIESSPRLRGLLSQGRPLFEWMSAPIPFFGYKSTPHWIDAYFIGDAAMSIPPACGGGQSQAVFSGLLAGRYVLKRDFVGFKSECRKQSSKMMRVAKILHYALMNPRIGEVVMTGCRWFPSVSKWLYDSTRQNK
jgi:menaquinone-9 beta-reductase